MRSVPSTESSTDRPRRPHTGTRRSLPPHLQPFAHHDTPREAVFHRNVRKINAHNADPSQTFAMALNEFADLDADEFSAMLSKQLIPRQPVTAPHKGGVLDKTIDWREQNAVTAVGNEGECGAPWAFSAAAAMESAHSKTNGELVRLSRQQLIDCATGSQGCNGGWMNTTYAYVVNAGGIESSANYPYTGQTDPCKYKKDTSPVAATFSAYLNLPANNEDALQKAVYEAGVVSVAVVASSWQFYSSGIMTAQACGTDQVNHAVALVSLSVDATGKPYYAAKNMWGENWGLNGYINLERGTNACGLAGEASYPIVWA